MRKQTAVYTLSGLSEENFLHAWGKIPASVVKKCNARELAELVRPLSGIDFSRLNFRRVVATGEKISLSA